ncbi:hypothetical protein HOC11_09010 [archaeon]|jgi:bifunctional DNA-binding transcriptional regulator/antitoxin component of YhaV-PrlF toxin-antitoxin module|nr:hypothetical protein [archaeon]
MKIIKINSKGSIAIVLPKELKKDYGWIPGTELKYTKDLRNQTITLYKKDQ